VQIVLTVFTYVYDLILSSIEESHTHVCAFAHRAASGMSTCHHSCASCRDDRHFARVTLSAGTSLGRLPEKNAALGAGLKLSTGTIFWNGGVRVRAQSSTLFGPHLLYSRSRTSLLQSGSNKPHMTSMAAWQNDLIPSAVGPSAHNNQRLKLIVVAICYAQVPLQEPTYPTQKQSMWNRLRHGTRHNDFPKLEGFSIAPSGVRAHMGLTSSDSLG
jgi:hypothetical protein